MHKVNRSRVVLFVCAAVIVFSSGCTNWKKKYNALNVEHQNLIGRLQTTEEEKGQLADEVTAGQQRIAELQRQIEQKGPGEASGFGEGYNVSFDPSKGTITVTLDNAILFSSGQATLKKATSAELDHIESVLRSKYAGREIDVVGHTDTDPINKTRELWKDNWELSAERALTVVRYLIGHGIPEDKIRAVGCGESRPVESNSTAAGKAKNRRVEIVVHLS